METVILIIYAVASYWATNKVLYEGKVVYYSSAYVHYMKKFHGNPHFCAAFLRIHCTIKICDDIICILDSD